MSFYVQKRLALGPIRFGVSSRRPESAIDDDPSLSTGARGEFLRKQLQGFFFADVARAAGPAALPPTRTVASTPFLDSLKPDGTRRGWGYLALMIAGVLFVLLGLAVVARKGAAGWVEVVLGLGMIATPIVLTAQRRKHLREQEERERAEREAIEARNRKMLADYSAALERLRTDRSADALANLERERAALTLPYELWSGSARDVILRLGFEELARQGAAAAPLIDRAASAAGLTPDDALAIKRDLVATFVWHLLADDRLGNAQAKSLAALAAALGVADVEASSIDQFRRLPTLALPKVDYRETTLYQADGLTVTNKRITVQEKKPVTVELPKIDEITADPDEGVVILRTADKPLRIKTSEPIVAAAMIDLATRIDVRPKAFA